MLSGIVSDTDTEEGEIVCPTIGEATESGEHGGLTKIVWTCYKK